MLANSKLNFTGNFDLSQKDINGDPNDNYRKITLTDTTDIDAAGVDITGLTEWWIIKSPLGDILHQGSVTEGDNNLSNNERVFNDVEIPLDSNGKILGGKYKIQQFIYDVNADATYNSPEVEVLVCNSNCATPSKPCVLLEFNCDNGFAKATDTSKYPAGSDVSRSITLSPPTGSAYADGTVAEDFVTTNSSIPSDALWSGSWEALLRAVVTHTQVVKGFTFTTLEYIESYKDGSPACEVNLCGLYGCLTKELDKIKKEANAYGGMSNNVALQDKANLILMESMSMEIARFCGNKTKVALHYNNLKELLDCDCGCSDSLTPQIILPISSSPSGNTVVIQPSAPITVSPSINGNITTYTIGFSQTLTELLAVTKPVNITSEDESVTVTPLGIVGGRLTFDLSVPSSTLLAGVNLACFAEAPESTQLQKAQAAFDLLCVLKGLNFSCFSDETDYAKKWNDFLEAMCGLLKKAPLAIDDSVTVVENTPRVIDLLDNDFISNYPVTTNVTVEPVNGTYEDLGDGKIRYTPNADFTGYDTLKYKIIDGNLNESEATVTIQVTAAQQGCVAATPSFLANIVNDGVNVTITLRNTTNWNGGTPNNTKFEISLKDTGGNIITQQNVNGVNDNTAMNIIIPYQVAMTRVDIKEIVQPENTTTHELCAAQTITTVGYVIPAVANTAPVANDDTYNATKNTLLVVNDPTQGLLANDTDLNNDTLAATAGTFATDEGGSITINANGTFTYNPLTDFVGTDTYTYEMGDGTDTATAQIIFTVSDTVEAPVPAADDIETDCPVGHNFTIALISDVADTGGYTYTVQITQAPTKGTLSAQGTNGDKRWTKTGTPTGDDTFKYTITTVGGTSPEYTVTIHIL